MNGAHGATLLPGMDVLRRGIAAQQAGDRVRAVAAYRKAIRINPGLAPAHFNLGQLLREERDYEGAATCFEAAVRLRPTAGDAWLNLGAMLERLERHQEAVAMYRRAVECVSEDVRPRYNLANALLALGEFSEAAEAYRAVLEQEPDFTGAQWNLATALLAGGSFQAGWTHYEHRWTHLGVDPARRFPWPLWAGEPVAAKRILVWREQGLGDELLFATCLRDLAAAGAEVTLAVSPRLVGMLTRAFPGVTVIDDGAWGDAAFDFQVPLGTLPRYLRKNRDAFPLQTKFLTPDSAHATRWTARLDALGPGLKVGICWRSGMMTEERSRTYSRLEEWGPVLTTPGIHWINLQYDDCLAELMAAEAEHGITIHRWDGEDLKNDLESVLGLIWNLDAVVTAPTAVSSLAGAAGVPTWQIDNGMDWTAHGEDRSPWFPSIRLIRRGFGSADWAPVLRRAAMELDARRVEEGVA